MKSILSCIVIFLLHSTTFYAQDVVIPDANFKAVLVGNSSINTNMDGEIQIVEAQVFAGPLNVSMQGITDLTGIEAFTALTNLDCSINAISNLDLSSNTALTVLTCDMNQLTTLDLSANTTLTYLSCSQNNLTNLDLSLNTDMFTVYASNNGLGSIDLSFNTNLAFFACNYCALTGLDVSANGNLQSLGVAFNNFEALDLSLNPLLEILSCQNNAALQILNVKNGNNEDIDFFAVNNNPLLDCIQVDDAFYSETNWTTVDAGVSFSENCFAGITAVAPTNFSIQPNPASDYISVTVPLEIRSVRIYSLTGELVQVAYESSFSIRNLPTGAYIISIETEEELIQSRFVRH